MKIDNLLSTMTPLIDLIKQTLPEASWPIVVRALRNDPLVWGCLTNDDFVTRVTEHAQDVPEMWSPGNLALLSLQFPITAKDLRFSPTDAIDQQIAEEADRTFELACESAENPNPQTSADIVRITDYLSQLSQAGLIALALRERRRLQNSWDDFFSFPMDAGNPVWQTAFACLYDYVVEPFGFLSKLITPNPLPSKLSLGLNSILSNPLSEMELANLSHALIDKLSASDQIMILEQLQSTHPELAKKLADRLIKEWPGIENISGLEPVMQLKVVIAHADLHEFAGNPPQVITALNSAWKTTRSLQANLLEKLVKTTNNHQTSGADKIAILADWDHATKVAAESPTYIANYATALIQAGRAEEAAELLANDDNKPEILLAKAYLATEDGDSEKARARELARAALRMVTKAEKANSKSHLTQKYAELADLLLKLSLPYDALRAASAATRANPTDPDIAATLGEAHRAAGQFEKALAAINLAVALAPSRMDFRYKLAESLELSGDWRAALSERTVILERIESPTSIEMRALANCALQAEEIQLAIEVSQHALQIDPGDGLAYALLGEAEVSQGAIEKGLEHLRQGTQLSPQESQPWLSLSKVQAEIGKISNALETLRTGTHAVPESADIHFALGEAYLSEASLTQAVDAFQRAGDISPESPKIALQLGKTLHQLGHLTEAKVALERSFTVLPKDVALAHAYGQVLLELDEAKEALSALIIVVQSEPSAPGPYYDYARALLAVGEGYADAVAALRKVLELDPENLRAKALLADGLGELNKSEEAIATYRDVLESELSTDTSWRARLALGLGKLSVKINQPDAAIAVLREALQDDGENHRLLRCLAEAYAKAQLRDDCLQTARDVLRLGADDLETLTWFAGLAIDQKAQAEALSALTRATELAPHRTDLLVLLGHTHIKTQDHSKAWETFTQVLSIDHVNPNDLQSAAKGFLALDDPHNAVLCFERALEHIDEPPIDLLLSLAESQERIGGLEAAVEVIDRAIAIDTENPQLHTAKSSYLLALDRPQAAMACMQHAINIDPENPMVFRDSVHIMRQIGDFQAAQNYAEQQIKLIPEDLRARTLAADIARTILQQKLARRILQDGWPMENDQEEIEGEKDDEAVFQYFCLYAELHLESEEYIAAAEALTRATEISPEHPRVMAIQARIDAIEGAREQAVRSLVNICHSVTEPEPEEKGEKLDTNPAYSPPTYLSIAEAALDLEQWNIAIEYYKKVLDVHSGEPYPNLKLAQTLVQRAEDQRFCESVAVINHAPGQDALSEYTYQTFENAITLASKNGHHENLSPQIERWSARGKAAFHPDVLSAQALSALPENPEDTAARIAVYRTMSDTASAVKAARTFPHSPRVLAQMALALSVDSPLEAFNAARFAAENSPGDPRYHALLAQAASISGDQETAQQSLEVAISIWPDEARWHSRLAQLISDTNSKTTAANFPGAISHFEQATKLEPNNPDHHRALGSILLAVNEHERAIKALQKASEINPEDADTLLSLAMAFKKAGKLPDAMKVAEKAMVLDPQRIKPHLLRAKIFLNDDNPQEALNSIRAAMRINLEDPQANHLQAKALSALNRPTEALSAIEKALAHAKKPLPMLIERIHLLRSTQGQEVALRALRELAAGYPDEPMVLFNLANSLVETNHIDEAIITAKRALRNGAETLSPVEMAELNHTLGRLLRRAGQLDQAVHHLSIAVEEGPTNLAPYLELGQTYMDRREFSEALHIYQKALAVSPKDARPYYEAGMALKEKKDYHKAEAMLRKAAELSPNDLSIHRQLGAVVALNIVHNNREASLKV